MQIPDPEDSEYHPRAQGVQPDDPAVAYFPARHVTQSMTLALREPAADVPGGHAEQALVPSEWYPEPQSKHEIDPAALNWPGRQPVHLSEESAPMTAEAFPAAQSVHSACPAPE